MRALLAVSILTAWLTPAGCRGTEGAASVDVALEVTRTLTGSPERYLLEGETLAVVHMEAEEPVTVATRAADGPMAELRRLLEDGEPPVRTGSVRLSLPEPGPELHGRPLEILLFRDDDGDGRWSPGEAYMSAWHGGRGGFRLVFFQEVPEGAAGARPGWNLLEGGHPVRYLPDLEALVTIDPVTEPVRVQGG